ncbi:uncharacterized protein C18orf19 homolog A [Coccinella septempunctata]|uniref:uncharacterized protein C18orf19 homolog A n=1 Tax=Coccinella septempunctata TaxID=41139 RepID=UPI001D067B3A|nr:uncharacterized protein C18orf19 homolog A [Coccinella septempunctata]
MATILSRLIRSNSNKILQVFECRCLSSTLFPIRTYTITTYQSVQRRKKLCDVESTALLRSFKYFSDEKKKVEIGSKEIIKPSLFQRFKQMYKEYWYVLIPVHIVTSIGWFGGFYYMASSGVDIIGVLEALHVNEKIINSMRDSHMGYVAIAYACYKIATPARYTVTLGGTTITINYLKKWGYIKPVPSPGQLKEMYKERKTNFDKSMKEKKEDLLAKREVLKSKIDNRLEQGLHKIEELKDKTDRMKKKAEDILKEKK